MAVETNARIEFSVASVEEWEKVNPKLHQGEPVFAKKPSGKYILKVGAPGGSTYKNAVVVWDQDDAETKMTSTQKAAAQALASKNAASASASAAKSSENAAAASKSAAATSEANAKTSETNAAASKTAAANSASTASAKATASANSASAAAISEKNAAASASAAATSESNALKSASAANTSAGNANVSETNAASSASNAAFSASAAAKSAEKAATFDPQYYLASKPSTGKNPESNPQMISIPTERGMFPIQGYPDGFTADNHPYTYAIVTNFYGYNGTLLSLYAPHHGNELYFRTGWNDERRWFSWNKLANANDVYTKTEVDNKIDAVLEQPLEWDTLESSSAIMQGTSIIYDENNLPSRYRIALLANIIRTNIEGKLQDYALKTAIPTKTSQLTNDSGFAVINSSGHLVINGSELWIE